MLQDNLNKQLHNNNEVSLSASINTSNGGISHKMFKYMLDENIEEKMRKRLAEKRRFYYVECVAGTIIMIYGIVLFVMSLYNPFSDIDK